MIKTETLPNNRIRHYSDSGMMMRQVETGILYADAVDTLPLKYSYEETDQPVPDEDVDDTEAIGILLGGAE